MFKALHRLLVLGTWCFWGVVAFFLYSQRARLQPALDYGELLWNRDRTAPAQLAVLTGTVTRVHTGSGFQVRDASGVLHNYGLAGIGGPTTNQLSMAREPGVAAQAMTNLAHWLVGERVRIEVTLSNPATRTGLGQTWLGETNVNERLLAEGLGVLRRDQIRRLPLEDQYRLVRAERLAREAQRGVWGQAR
jgi:endonuclease YncB( thermonuclease family)